MTFGKDLFWSSFACADRIKQANMRGQMSVVSNFYVTSHSSRNFVSPDEFAPERWLDGDDSEPRFEADKRSASIPFSLGHRDCIGKKYVLSNYARRCILLTIHYLV